MSSTDRAFQGIWIPRAVYLSKEANWYAKILFLEIHGFTEKGMECYMSNGYDQADTTLLSRRTGQKCPT